MKPSILSVCHGSKPDKDGKETTLLYAEGLTVQHLAAKEYLHPPTFCHDYRETKTKSVFQLMLLPGSILSISR